ncbi:unnamed protein product [Didymodactylos carnosus]|uniref:Uncharacterized protein n=1 Tax=Didymodactylos carnosus TaxID=1234261 RepID=A0A815R9R7_9BILA|nr:unnamed protein product [Didymodactylos carnosus]CAF1473668.1 unnamed protein product [Didymodactylos carnosus]CAF4157337.1 unnamed protein product [Didymodactylos carnosus]CAF4340542.1 unnamed protein product [Didymodactylos carnosus]
MGRFANWRSVMCRFANWRSVMCRFANWRSVMCRSPIGETALAFRHGELSFGETTRSMQPEQLNGKIWVAVVFALFLVGIMYGIDVLDTNSPINSNSTHGIELSDTSGRINTKCTYGIFRMIATFGVGVLIASFMCNCCNTSAVAKIKIHGIEKRAFWVFAGSKLIVSVCVIKWFSNHSDGSCKTPAITVGAVFIDSFFNLIQFIFLLNKSLCDRLQRSPISYVLLIAMNFGLIWFALSEEVLHLKHYTHDNQLKSEWWFLIIQATFWLGLEFNVAVVEVLINGLLERDQQQEYDQQEEIRRQQTHTINH